MIEFSNGGILVESLVELPNIIGTEEIYLDFETTSGDRAVKALQPYKGHKILGAAISIKDTTRTWYIPRELLVTGGFKWLQDVFNSAIAWINHGVKFDAHCAHCEGLTFEHLALICTLTLAKLIDSDRFKYSLDVLSKEWLNEDISKYDLALQSSLNGSKDYGDAPLVTIAEYACQDIITNKKLHAYIKYAIPEEVNGVARTEQAITPVLFDIERSGLKVDVQELKIAKLLALNQLNIWETKIAQLASPTFNPNSAPQCFDLFCNHYKLPILKETKKGAPSFDAATMKLYKAHPIVVHNRSLTELLTIIGDYKKLYKFVNSFVDALLEYQVNGIVRCNYNQAVRTGRMSCREPNMQQQNKKSKDLIHPDGDTCAFLAADYSQIEFRIMMHAIKNEFAISSYINNPSMDFHNWVAESAKVEREAAKTTNFGIGFGAGMKRLINMLRANKTIIAEMVKRVDTMIQSGELEEKHRLAAFSNLCTARAEMVYKDYHAALPELKPTMKAMGATCLARGYIRNPYKRRRHLKGRAAWKAFNGYCQSGAADMLKERVVAIAPRYNKTIRDLGISIKALVHDDIVFHGEKETLKDPRILSYISSVLESPSVAFRVPMYTSFSYGEKSWGETKGKTAQIDRSLYESISRDT